MNRISDFQVLTLRNQQVVLQYVVRSTSGYKSVQRVFASSIADAYSRIIEVDEACNGW